MNEIQPKISVIVPVYKAEDYLHRCVDSLLAQTFRDFEVLLVDDGSPDCSGKICDDYACKDTRVKFFMKETLQRKLLIWEHGAWIVAAKYAQFISSIEM